MYYSLYKNAICTAAQTKQGERWEDAQFTITSRPF